MDSSNSQQIPITPTQIPKVEPLSSTDTQINKANSDPAQGPQVPSYQMNKNIFQNNQQQISPFLLNFLYQNMNNNQNNFNFNSQGSFNMNNGNGLINAFTTFFNYHNQRLILSQQNYTADTLKSEYEALKRIDHDNPQKIKDNLNKFENNILLPFYININQAVSSKRAMYTETFNKYKTAITKVLKNLNIEETTTVNAYGSIMNNFLIEDGDIDICIVPEISIEDFSVHLKEIQNEITSSGIGTYQLSHISPRYSLLKVIDNDTGLTVDITVHTKLPLRNTRLIRTYSLYDQRFHLMGIYIKNWAKRNKLNGATDKYLSSYALLVMIIHFLQSEVHPSVLPILQRVQNETQNYTYSHTGEEFTTNLYFEEDMDKVKEYMKVINNNEENTMTATELIVKFFEFYAYKYEHKYLISISSGEQKTSSSEHIAFPIEDPFDIEHNPGKSMKLNTQQYELFMNCMKKEINMLLSGEYVSALNVQGNSD